VQNGDVVIVCAYAFMTPEETKNHKPLLVFPDTSTNLLR
jgi:aspartate 1-decarboxylase